jgi:hypothetical protein
MSGSLSVVPHIRYTGGVQVPAGVGDVSAGVADVSAGVAGMSAGVSGVLAGAGVGSAGVVDNFIDFPMVLISDGLALNKGTFINTRYVPPDSSEPASYAIDGIGTPILEAEVETLMNLANPGQGLQNRKIEFIGEVVECVLVSLAGHIQINAATLYPSRADKHTDVFKRMESVSTCITSACGECHAAGRDARMTYVVFYSDSPKVCLPPVSSIPFEMCRYYRRGIDARHGRSKFFGVAFTALSKARM